MESLGYNLNKYHRQVDINILKDYKPSPHSIWVNTDDKDLEPIEILLPDEPEWHLIDNFGLPAKEQRWHPPKMPYRLKELERKYDTIDEIWNEIESHPDIYIEEIKFIKLQWKRRLEGYWFFNNGQITYIDGWHYFYCGWWHIDKGLPEYRDRDRRFFLFARKIYNETKAPICDENGFAIKKGKDKYDWVDTGSRLFYGFIYLKHRREGATCKAECINYEIISRTMNAHGGIQSMNEKKAAICFTRHLIAPWKKLPFFFKPLYEGSTSPKTELSFMPPARRLSSRGAIAKSEEGLNSGIDFGDADESAYEMTKLYFHHDDEIGRLRNGLSCVTRHAVVRECLVEGSEIIGFTIKTSTAGEMEKGGGKEVKQLCEMSNYYRRNPNGRTISGLAILFIPAYDGLQGFIDRYGMSVIDTPTKEQEEFIHKKIGARQFLMNERKGFIDKSDMEGLSGKIREYPMRFAENFRTAQKSSGFNITKLEIYIDNLSFSKSEINIGNFVWQNNIPDSRVIFVTNPQGKFRVSYLLDDKSSNLKYWDDVLGTWIPGNTSWGVAGGDPFKFNKTQGSRKSKGGGAVIRRAKIKDKDFSMKRKFVCTYANRTYDKNIYAEDMLMMCVYYGVKMFPEISIPLLWDYFEQRGYGGYLLYKRDPHSLEFSKTPGGSSSEKVKQQIFMEFDTWIENEADIETHIEILEECRDIEGPKDMTNYDLFTAAGYALLGTVGIYDEIDEQEEEEKYDLNRCFRKRVYS